jgi:glycogen(starch) synthase
MKLLIYSHFFAPSVGGVETFAMNLASGLAMTDSTEDANNFTVTIITQTLGTESNESNVPSFRIVRKPDLLDLWRLVGDAERILLVGPAILPLVFALIRRRILVVSHHGYQSICPNGMLFQFPAQTCCPGHFAAGRYGECVKCNAPQESLAGSIRILLLTFVRRALCRLAASNIAVSQHVAMRIALPRSYVIRNGVPVVPPPPHLPAGASPIQAPINFAYVGRLVTEKGVSVLVHAARVLKGWGCRFQVLIIGDGPERAALQALTSSLNLDNEVCFLGFQGGPQLQESMNKVSALVMPSICEDVAPFSVLEQMMRERLIIGSKIGGLAEEIGDTGLTFEPGNAAALAERMRQIIHDPHLIETLGKRARDRALAWYTLQHQLFEYRALLGGL